MTSKTKRMLGIGFLVSPPLGLMLTLSLYAIATFIISAVISSSPDATSIGMSNFAQAVKVFLGLMGAVFTLGIIIGPILGGYLIYTAGDDGSFAPRHRRIDELSVIFLFSAGMSVLLRVPDLFVHIPDMKSFEDIGAFLASLSISSILLGIAATFAHLVAVIIFLFWIGRAANNLKLVMKRKLKVDPFFLAWGNLIPVYNIFHPIVAFPGFWKDVAEHYHVAKDEFVRVLWAIRAFFIVDVAGFLLSYNIDEIGARLGLAKTQTVQIENYITFVFHVVSMCTLMYFVYSVTKRMKKS